MSWFTSGIDPGWANDALPLLLAGTCEDVEQLRVMEIVNYKDYEQPTVLFETMGFGKPLDAKPLLLIPGVLDVRVGRGASRSSPPDWASRSTRSSRSTNAGPRPRRSTSASG